MSTFSINPALKQKLLESGFTVLMDLRDMKPIELSKEIGVTPKQALDILKTIKADLEAPAIGNQNLIADPERVVEEEAFTKREVITGQTAYALLEEELNCCRIITFCKDIDVMLGGGVPTGKITEFCGVPGIGKTQMAIQLTVNVHIPAAFGGAEGHAIYIDTEGSFMIERAVEMAEALVEHIASLRALQEEQLKESPDAPPLPPPLETTQILENIHYYRIHDYIEQIALVNILPAFLSEHPAVRLIVVDSISFHFRYMIYKGGTTSRT
uniref:DNA repair protein RAD51 homolog 3 n=1 Tax=Arcella intermedia TaxID=1963864 RepID=A0A6B2LDH7_9EUKA